MRSFTVVQAPPGTEEWRKYLTASRVAAVLGLTAKFQNGESAETVRNEIVTGVSDKVWSEEDQENANLGKRFQDGIIQEWRLRQKIAIRPRQDEHGLLVSRERPWLGASPDGWLKDPLNGLCGVEVKKPIEYGLRRSKAGRTSYTLNKWLEYGPPDYYRVQCQIGMYVTGIQNWLLLACIGGRLIRPFWIHRDLKEEKEILHKLDCFWESVERARNGITRKDS